MLNLRFDAKHEALFSFFELVSCSKDPEKSLKKLGSMNFWCSGNGSGGKASSLRKDAMGSFLASRHGFPLSYILEKFRVGSTNQG